MWLFVCLVVCVYVLLSCALRWFPLRCYGLVVLCCFVLFGVVVCCAVLFYVVLLCLSMCVWLVVLLSWRCAASLFCCCCFVVLFDLVGLMCLFCLFVFALCVLIGLFWSACVVYVVCLLACVLA